MLFTSLTHESGGNQSPWKRDATLLQGSCITWIVALGMELFFVEGFTRSPKLCMGVRSEACCVL